MENHKFTKEEYMRLWDENIPKKEYDFIIIKIESRFHYIMKTICTKLSWYDYDNGREGHNGHFEPNKYHYNEDSYINFDGEYSLPEPFKSCPNIPIKWLWEDFEEGFKKEVEDFKKKERERIDGAKAKREATKVKRAEIKENIKSKLTKVELKYIKFK